MTRILSLLLLCLLCCRTPLSRAADIPVSDENIHINADRMNQNPADGLYTAEGNVVALWQGQKLTADRVVYSASTHLLNANGSVVLTKGAAILKGETLVLNIDSGRAEMDSTLLTVPESGMKIASGKLIRLNENEFNTTSTEMTSCDMPDPSWKFGADKLDVDMQGYATGRNVIFYIKNIPVLYLPWGAFPVIREKRSGLLFPQLGYSGNKGMRLDIPIYWVISPSQDLQLDLDLMSRRGAGTGIEYRYLRTRGSEGHISTYSIYDQIENQWRGQFSLEHKELFSGETNFRASINGTSDRSFLKDFGDKSGDYNRQSNDTIINALKTWQTYAVTSYLRYNEDLYATDNKATLQTLPSLGLSGVRQSLFPLPLYFDLDSSIDNLYRETAPNGQRIEVFPRFTLLPFQSSILHTSMYAGAHIRGYATAERSTSSEQARSGDVLPEAGVRASTSLSRIYDTDATLLKKIRHEIIPEFSYGFVPEHNQQRLPFYDYTDRLIHRNIISLSATSLMNGKFVTGETTEYRDISRIKLSADYALAGGRRDLLTLVEKQRPWSDLMLESETWVTKLLRITFDTRYNLYEKVLSTAVAGIEIDDRQGNTIGAGYQMARNEVEYFEGRLSTKLIKPLTLSYTARYSFDRGDFLETIYTTEYRHKCWSITMGIHQRPGNQSYIVNFNLAGLGGK